MITINDLLKRETQLDLNNCLTFLAYRGSKLHNTYIEGISDTDLIGFATPPLTFILGLNNAPPNKWEQFEHQSSEEDGDWDVIIYSMDKVVRLMLKCNPNLMELLWIPENKIIVSSWQYHVLRDHRHFFSSKLAYKAFGKYAIGQLHRMKNGGFTRDMGAKRKAIVKQFGYDTKNASSLILLLKQGIEFLKTGNIVCSRTDDADYLMNIKRGCFPLLQIQKAATALMIDLDEAHATSILPEQPDKEVVDKLLIQLMSKTYIEACNTAIIGK